MFSIRVYDRSDNPVALPAGCTARPVRWAWAAVGGPADAEIEVSGVRNGLIALAGWLGYRLEIANADGERVWWGDVEACEIAFDGMAVGISLENLANRVQVRYSQRQAGGTAESADTDWAEDAASVAQFGTFERRINASREMTSTEAEALRYTAVARYLAPAKTMRTGQQGQYATLRCVGYWQRLRRVYYSQLAGLVEYVDGSQTWPVGLGFTSSTVAFAASPQTINEVYGRLQNFGYSGLQVKVTGSSSNNGAYTVSEANRKSPVAYTATTIRFGATDDIGDTANGFAFMATDDIIQISGSASNDGTDIIKTTGADGVEVSPGYGGAINNAAAGPSVTIRRGNAIVTAESIANELAGSSVTVTAYGQRLYQTFTLPANATWTVDTIELRVRQVGSPGDSLRVRLYVDSSGSPGTLLETQDVLGSTLPTETAIWTAINFANTTALSYGTTYGIEVSRTGSNDPDDYYEFDIDADAGYSGGLCRVYDGAAWQTPSTAMDLLFRVLGGIDLATQVASMATATGTEILGATVESAANIVGNQYRAGELTALDEASALLMVGTSGGFRMLTTVTAAEWVRIHDEPLPSEARYIYTGDGRLLTLQGQPAPAGTCPAGEYVVLDNAHLLPGAWAALSPFLVERAECRESGEVTLEPAGMYDNFEIGLEGG